MVRDEAYVVVDPFSTGALLAQRVVASGRRCIRVLSEYNSPVASLVAEGAVLTFDATVQHDDTIDPAVAADETARQLRALPWPVAAVVPGAETGVPLADLLAHRLGTRANPLELSRARRNKFDMGEAVRAAGVRAARQRRCAGWADAEAFLAEWRPDPFVVVVKPVESAGSDDVFKCASAAEVKAAVEKIVGAVNGLGAVNEGALVQEFLDGTEYVIDSVSRDGHHKVVALWEYDKRSVNGTNFVYFGTHLRPASGELADQLLAYGASVLDALGIRNGPGHMEVKMTRSGPCLVEVGSRCHGGEGTWVPTVLECIGYSQVDAALDAYVAPAKYDALPDRPATLTKHGAEIDIVAFRDGIVTAIPGVDAVRRLASFRRLELAVQPGMKQVKTRDCFTRPGSVVLTHEDEATFRADVEAIRALEQHGMFEFAE